jgi:lysozyme family protein
MSIQSIIDGIIKREGSTYTNDPNDAGGPTKFGITLHTLASYRGGSATAGAVERLTIEEARHIYEWRYVSEPGFDYVLPISGVLAVELIDTGVNLGPPRATEMLQRALNSLNRQGKDYPDIKVDMLCGPATIKALRSYLTKRGPEGEIVLLRALNCLQGAFYIGLAERRPTDESFLYGWLLNRVST